jgi:GntR family transcriptional regulator/MocR family aminotransferase
VPDNLFIEGRPLPSPTPFLFSLIHLDPQGEKPLYWQIYAALREAILTQHLQSGVRLPSTRDLATMLSVSRNTVVNAMNQLTVEGYLEVRPRSGTYVADDLPEALLHTAIEGNEKKKLLPSDNRALSQRGGKLALNLGAAKSRGGQHLAFSYNRPAIDEFPFHIWTRLINKEYRQSPLSLFRNNPQERAGYAPLREAIATHLRVARAVQCDAEQVIIVSGSQQGLYLAAHTLLDPGDDVWIENPNYLGARIAFLSAGANLIPVPIRKDGLDVAVGQNLSPSARCAYTTPSHQFPLGYMMSLKTRLKLLDWAENAGAWIIEDDYDSEYRFSGHPVPALQGLDRNRRVIYLGTFSKVMFPNIRLGYIVVPPDLVDAFKAARFTIDTQSQNVVQAAMTEFIVQGYFSRHIRRMRRLYAERYALLVAEAERILGDRLPLIQSNSGMHLIGWLPSGSDDQLIREKADQHGVSVAALSDYYLGDCPKPGLLMGFADTKPEDIRAGINRLARVLDEL